VIARKHKAALERVQRNVVGYLLTKFLKLSCSVYILFFIRLLVLKTYNRCVRKRGLWQLVTF